MKLHVGERFPGLGPSGQPGGYVVTGVVAETPWTGLYLGKKLFCNFDFTEKRPREAEDREWLDVYLRTVQYPQLDDWDYVAGRRALARAEIRRVLGSSTSPVWPEPVDLLEIHNTRDSFALAEGSAPRPGKLEPLEPVGVFARPQGQPLRRWRQTASRPAMLALLAELLGFVRAAHEEGLIVNGLGPETVLVDGAGRTHYLGSDMAVAPADGFAWGRFFPPERYAVGFAAPECFDPAAPRDQRTDLYAWAVLAWSLLTGGDPAALARQQDRSWVRFGAAELAQLEKALRSLAPATVAAWAEQLNLPAAPPANWVPGFVAAFRQCLAAEPRQRPVSVAELLSWLVAPPPAPVAAALALRVGDQQVRLFFDLAGFDPAARLVVRRLVGTPSLSRTAGTKVSEAAPRSWMDDAVPRRPAAPCVSGPEAEPIYYNVFARLARAGGETSSIVTPAQVFEPTPTNLRRLAESLRVDEGPAPAAVALLFQALDGAKVGEALLASSVPAVRGWAIAQLGSVRQAGQRLPGAEALLWRGLADPSQAVRLEAAAGLLRGTADRALVRRVLETLGGGDLDEALQAARLLSGLGVERETLHQAAAELEATRPAICPVCGQAVPARDRPLHLQSVHGYIDVAGNLLPRGTALERLWGRVFEAMDGPAHDQLLNLLGASAIKHAPGPGSADSPYTAALRDQLHQRAEGLWLAGSPELARLVRCLRHSPKAHAHFPALLRDDHPIVRELGRELVLPDLAARLAASDVTAARARAELDRICTDDQVEEKILLCRQLPYRGVDPAVVKECLGSLQAERPVLCPECGQQLVGGQVEGHLRQVHRIFEFRGARRSLQQTLAALLDAVCGQSPDAEAWAALQTIMAEEYAAKAEAMQASWLAQKLFTLSGEQRQQAVESVAEVVAASPGGPRLVLLLACLPREAASRPSGLHLALETTARLPGPVETAVVQAVKPLLGDRQAPVEARQAALVALLRGTAPAGPAARELLLAFTAGTAKEAAVRRLRGLEQPLGQLPAIDALCQELEDQITMRCTRCPAELPRARMVQHLWDDHRLVLEGRRVREPWRLIEDWLEDYRLERDPQMLARCQELAHRLDPQDGPAHLQRLQLRHGLDEAGARRTLLSRARQEGASVCPNCYALVSAQDSLPPATVDVGPGELEAGGFGVYVSDRWLVPWLTIQTPDEVLCDGLQPGWRQTRAGLALYVAVAVVLLMLGLMFFVSLPVLLGVSVAAAALLGGLGWLSWPAPRPLRDRAIDAAWSMLAPALLEKLTRQASAFLAGLARVSSGRGARKQRADLLEEACAVLEDVLKDDPGRARHLGAVRHLWLDDTAEERADVLPLLLEQAERCLDGKVPLSLLDEVVTPQKSVWERPGIRARLRVLLCVRAFERGLECSDLMDLGRAYPNLGAALGVEDPMALAQVRLLWWLRQARPWARLGDIRTVFELAQDARGVKRLEQCPELLLAVELTPPLYVGTRGVWLEGTWIRELPQSTEIVAQQRHAEGAQLVIVGPHRFRVRDNADELTRVLERCLRYYFRDFLPQAESALRWRAPGTLTALAARNGVKCPECRRRILPCLGEMAILLEEPEPARQASAV
jgi:hypothetical protein